MEKVIEIFEKTKKNSSSEILMSPFSEPRIRTQDGWIPVTNQRLDSEEVRETLFSILSERQKETLQNEGVVTGSVSLNRGFNINFHIYRHKLGYSGNLKTILVEKSDDIKATIPTVITDQVLKGKGLILIAGPTWSGKSTLMGKLLEVVNQTRSAHVAIVETVVDRMFQMNKSVITSFEVGFNSISESIWQSLESADVVAIDTPFSIENINRSLNLVEAGKVVLLTVGVDSLSSFQNRINHLVLEEKREFFFERLAQSMSLFVNQRLLSSLQDQYVLAQEIILFNESLRDLLRAGEVIEIMNYVNSQGEKQGMKSMNRSLLQLFLRKKINLKEAFLASPNLDELDRYLSQLGG